jgi:hypothetical protein
MRETASAATAQTIATPLKIVLRPIRRFSVGITAVASVLKPFASLSNQPGRGLTSVNCLLTDCRTVGGKFLRGGWKASLSGGLEVRCSSWAAVA